MIKLSVIFVYYNEFELLKTSLKKVLQQLPKNAEVIVVENNAEKKHVTKLESLFPHVLFIHNKENVGFARGANVGLKKAKGEYLLLLTPDTELLPNTISETLAYIEKHPGVAIVGCKIFSEKSLQLSAGKAYPGLISHLFEYNQLFYLLINKLFPSFHPTFFSLKEHKKVLEVNHMIGAYLLMRKKAIAAEGYFDDYYYMYREETDLCKRLKDAGWKLIYLPVGGLIHKENPHKKIKITQSNPFYLRNTYFLFKRYEGVYYAYLAYVLAFLSVGMSLLLFGLYGVIQKYFGKTTQSYLLLSVWRDIFLWHSKNIFTIVTMDARI